MQKCESIVWFLTAGECQTPVREVLVIRVIREEVGVESVSALN